MVSAADAKDAGLQALHLLISGRVQGVGFRYALAHEARALGLRGWVRNILDGRVEAIVQGPPDALEKLTAWARRGPALARVSAVTPRPVTLQAPCSRFDVAPTARNPEYP